MFSTADVIMLDKVDSTNLYARKQLKNSSPAEGTVIIAKEQTAGRGQQGNSWLSPYNMNLTFSIIIYPFFLKPNRQFQLNKAISLGVAKFVNSCLSSPHVSIKWSNDIYIDNKKIAGLLIENGIENSRIKYSIIGIGININQVVFDSSLPNPVSLKLISGKDFDLLDSLNKTCISIEKYYNLLRDEQFSIIDDEYNNLLYRKDVLCNYLLNNKPIKGIIKGVNTQGHLLLKVKDQEIVINEIKRLVYL